MSAIIYEEEVQGYLNTRTSGCARAVSFLGLRSLQVKEEVLSDFVTSGVI